MLVPRATGDGIELQAQPFETTIIDNDRRPTLRLSPVGEVTEGHSTMIEVSLTNGLTTAVRVSLAYGVGSTASQNDYTLSEVNAEIAAGKLTATFNLEAVQNELYELTETLILVPSASAVGLEGITGEPGVIMIGDDEAPPTVSLESLGQVNEPHPRGHSEMRKNTSLTVTVRLSGALENTVTVSLLATNESAEDDDYTISPASVTILPGATVAEFTLSALRNNLQQRNIEYFEGTEILTLEPVAIIAEGSVRLPTDGSVPHQVAISESLPVPELEVVVNGGPTSFNEGQQRIELVAVPDDVTEFTVTLTLRRRADSTAGDTDFELESDTVEIGPGGVAFLYLDIIDDVIYEGDETLIFEGYATGGGIELPVRPLVTEIIDDNDRPTLIGPVGEVTEGHSTTIEVSLTSILNVPVSVSLAYGVGSTASQNDYTLSEIDAEIAAGKLTATFNLEAVQNELYELTETLILVPSAIGVGLGEITGEPGVITIVDDDALPTVSLDAPGQVAEGDSITITVRLDGVLESTVTVELLHTNGNAESDDYTISPARVTILPGATVAKFTLTARPDITPTFETTETLTLNPVAIIVEGSVSLPTDSSVPHRVTISESLPVPFVVLQELNNFILNEGQQGVQIRAVLQHLTEFTVTVSLSRGAGSTAEEEDYELETSTLEIGAGKEGVLFTLDITDDELYEGDEELILEGHATGNGLELPVPNPVVMIIDDEQLPILSLDQKVASIDEGAGVTLTVSLDGKLEVPVTVSLLTGAASTAKANDDYTLSPLTFRIESGQTIAIFRLDALSDKIYEGNEQLVLVPRATGDGIELRAQPFETTIIDNDRRPTLRLSPVGEVTEGHSTMIEVSLTNGLTTAVRVSLAYGVGSTASQNDYTLSEVNAEIAAGKLTATFNLEAVQNELYELTETLILVPSASAVGLEGITGEPGVIMIGDDEAPPTVSLESLGQVNEPHPRGHSEMRKNTSLTVTVRLSGALENTVTVSLLATNESAEDDDYTISPASVTILPGATVAEFTLSALRNNLQQRNIEYFEGTEILTLELVAIIAEGSVRLPTDGSVPHQVAISESLPVPELEVVVNGGPTSFNEGQQRIELAAVPDDVTEFTVTLTLRRRADSTAGDTDFELESDTVEIGPGGVAFLYLDIIDDVIYEEDETLIFEGYATGGGIELPVRPLVTEIIDNNDPRPTLRIGEVGPLVNEGESLTFTVEVVGSANYSQTLTFRPIFRGGEGGAEAADLRSPLPDFTIAVPADRDGNSPIRRFEFTIRTNQDSIYENTELFNFELILRDNNGVVRDRYDGFVDIMDDEPIPTISPLNVPLSEGESQTLEIVFESAASVDVTLTLVLENAVEGVTAGDYSLTPSDVFISAGMTSAVVSLLALDDSDREGEERFDLRLVSASSGVTVAVGSVVTVTIEASDQRSSFQH